MFEAWESEQNIRVVPSIHFTGGEPLLYPGFWEAVNHAREACFSVAIMTNGCLVTDEDARRFMDLGVFEVQVSLEGPEALHDDIRGRGSFKAALKGAERLSRAGNKVSANVTLSRVNSPFIGETVKIARESGFAGIGFSRLVPCGSGKNMLAHLLSPAETRLIYEKIHSLNGPDFEVVSGDPLAVTLREGVQPTVCELTLSGCSAGFSGVTICCDGTVMPCRRIGLSVGNIKRKSLRQIWATSQTLWKLRNRASYKGKCGDCALWPSCRGCRAVAYAHSKARGRPDLFADDPQCWRVTAAV
jgi:AdoMet-dependent heme synthase